MDKQDDEKVAISTSIAEGIAGAIFAGRIAYNAGVIKAVEITK